MVTLTRLVLVAFVSVALSAVGSPAGAADTTAQATSVTTITEGPAAAGIQSAGMASRAPGARCGKKHPQHRAAARRSCAQRPGGR